MKIFDSSLSGVLYTLPHTFSGRRRRRQLSFYNWPGRGEEGTELLVGSENRATCGNYVDDDDGPRQNKRLLLSCGVWIS